MVFFRCTRNKWDSEIEFPDIELTTRGFTVLEKTKLDAVPKTEIEIAEILW